MIATLTDERATFTDKTDTLTDETDTLTDEIATFTDEIATATDEIANFTNKIAIFTNETATFTDQIATLTNETATPFNTIGDPPGEPGNFSECYGISPKENAFFQDATVEGPAEKAGSFLLPTIFGFKVLPGQQSLPLTNGIIPLVWNRPPVFGNPDVRRNPEASHIRCCVFS